MSMTKSRDNLLNAILELLWAQWTELGISGTKGSTASIIDPEALLVATLAYGRHDPRLFDEVLDWLALHSDTLDVTRLRRIGAIAGPESDRILGTVIDFMRERGSAQKWSGAAARALAREAQAAYRPESLFIDNERQALPTFGEHDEFFASHGYLRPPVSLRGMSVAPDVRRPSLARLRLRALAGQGFRAEVLLYLTTHDHAHGRLVAQRAAFSQRQVAEYLTALAEAGFAEAWDEGRTRQYRLSARLAEGEAASAAYVDWIGGFGIMRLSWVALSAATAEPDPYSASSRLRAGLDAIRVQLPVEGLGLPLPEPDRFPGERVLDHAIQWTEALEHRIRELAG